MFVFVQNSTNLKYLLCRLDFNEFYQIREEQKRNFGGKGEDEDMDNYNSEDDDDDDDEDDDDDVEDDDDDDDDEDEDGDSGNGMGHNQYRSEVNFSDMQSYGNG